MLLKGNSLNVSLLMMVLSLQQQDQVPRELLGNARQCAQSAAPQRALTRPGTW